MPMCVLINVQSSFNRGTIMRSYHGRDLELGWGKYLEIIDISKTLEIRAIGQVVVCGGGL